MKVTVSYNQIPTSAKKIRFFLGTIRGKTVEQALATIRSTARVTARPIEKLLLSGTAIMRDRMPEVETKNLLVSEIYCNEGSRRYRTRLRGRGRASRFAKKMAHLTVTVEYQAATDKAKKANKNEKTDRSSDTVNSKRTNITNKPTNKKK